MTLKRLAPPFFFILLIAGLFSQGVFASLAKAESIIAETPAMRAPGASLVDRLLKAPDRAAFVASITDDDARLLRVEYISQFLEFYLASMQEKGPVPDEVTRLLGAAVSRCQQALRASPVRGERDMVLKILSANSDSYRVGSSLEACFGDFVISLRQSASKETREFQLEPPHFSMTLVHAAANRPKFVALLAVINPEHFIVKGAAGRARLAKVRPAEPAVVTKLAKSKPQTVLDFVKGNPYLVGGGLFVALAFLIWWF